MDGVGDQRDARGAAQADGPNTLVPELINPVFIATPPFTRIAAGVTVLHLLSHSAAVRRRSKMMKS